jgi:hypothetical protein
MQGLATDALIANAKFDKTPLIFVKSFEIIA